MTVARNLLMVGVAFALPFAVAAQTADTSYCNALSEKYRASAAHKGDSPEAIAMSKCAKEPASAIPVLEKSLKDAKIPLPPRT